MSFSASFTASQATGIVSIEEIKAKQIEFDSKYGSAAILEEHQRQIALAAKAIEGLCEAFPDKVLGGTMHGHASEDRTGNVGVSYFFQQV